MPRKMPRKFKNADRAKVKNPLPQWVELPKESGFYWVWCEDDEECPPNLCTVEIMEHGIFILQHGLEEEIEIAEMRSKPFFHGPVEEPQSPFLTRGLSEYSIVGTNWAYDADRKVMRHLRQHTEVDLENGNYSGWLFWLRGQHWFAPYMEEEFHKMCEKYAPRGWMK